MKLLPSIQLPQLPPPVSPAAAAGMDSRLPPGISLPFSPTELLWRYGPAMNFPPANHPPPHSPFLDFKTHLPTSLASDPRLWSREDVATFLRWAEHEFDLPQFDMDMFQMNGKALCLLTKPDLGERCPGAGDVLHNVLSMLARDFSQLQRCLPSSPVTPTRPSSYPLSPHSHPPTPTWSDNPYTANLASLMSANSVTLSPAPSVDSQAGSPGQENNQSQVYKSDSDEDNNQNNGGSSGSPPNTPTSITAQRLSEVCVKEQQQQQQQQQGPAGFRANAGGAREFFGEAAEPNTNGRLLWDFLQQLLNDPSQRYTQYIAWKSRETGVFKIVDPPRLARLWGIQKNHLSMNYDKMSRALRYYYRVNILRKVQGERHCYQFLRNPTELKNIKNISLLRQQMRIKSEPEDGDGTTSGVEPEIDMPTDLSMSTMSSQPPNDQQNSQPSSNAVQQPLPLHDPPAKYRSHAYNLVKTNQEDEKK
ncbi:ets DNA-binding protein pokkuri [Ceratina calcarata]|uniref:Ets DNA-binding protein pokkuri n=1 Tax=Ceratina calcarata TaxID=156304 RepID=A0AAJ7S688_9HYME|nr:ets DNA-binding protein pokkuri [Ceratina calcarata]XP_017885721.1 ets DNA-binding protein pokkuri [Ceratina calcarata]XP_017885722.1 ets DNA-binding protein pokkuri [Ceratina calcarata]XP_026672240.1 ets DNA-binding protein pokkuri [Ceratina calcarata]